MKMYALCRSDRAKSFFFDNLELFQQQADPDLEYLIDMTEGSQAEYTLFEVFEPNQSDLEDWFEVAGCSEEQQAALYFLGEYPRYTLADALDKQWDVQLYEGCKEDVAEEVMSDCFDIPESLTYYIAYDKWARDCELGGDWVEFNFAGTTLTCTNANCF